jgi:Protein of unknown function (DUF4256)
MTKEFLTSIKSRFLAHPHRHPDITWEAVESRLLANPDNLAILERMEATGGEPDVVWHVEANGEYVFIDCSPESPTGRRSLCYDNIALDTRKENKPKNSVEMMAKEIGITLLSEEEYRHLQTFDNFDIKTSSWIDTPESVRKLGGALFGDRRYDRVFTYHNGADSYYAARGFRGKISI